MLKFLKSFLTKKDQPTSAEATANAAPYKIETPAAPEEKAAIGPITRKTVLKKAGEKKPAVKAKTARNKKTKPTT